MNDNRKDLVIYNTNNAEGRDRFRVPRGLNKRLPVGGAILTMILAGLEGHGFDEHSPSIPASGSLFDGKNHLFISATNHTSIWLHLLLGKTRSVYCG